jgi:hypothetical protein
LNDDIGRDLEMTGAVKTSRLGGLRQMSVGAVAERVTLPHGVKRELKELSQEDISTKNLQAIIESLRTKALYLRSR